MRDNNLLIDRNRLIIIQKINLNYYLLLVKLFSERYQEMALMVLSYFYPLFAIPFYFICDILDTKLIS